MIATIEIILDAKCKRCGKKGATQNGYCLGCIIKRLEEGAYDHVVKPAQGNLADEAIKAIDEIANEKPPATGAWDWDRPPGFSAKRPQRAIRGNRAR